jgi:hypothetical protein
MKIGLSEIDSLFPQPFRFVKRENYSPVRLPAILATNPQGWSIYLAYEKRTYCHYNFLRIHSSPPFWGAKPQCSWFEKRLPDNLHIEDILPWFVATIRRLPKKQQPADIDPWIKRLLSFEPHFLPDTIDPEQPWASKPKIVLVFGPVGKVGYRSLEHFERKDISRIIRQRDVITVTGVTRHHLSKGKTREIERTFYLLATDDAAAERVEREIFRGQRIHFGLDGDIFGMMERSGHVIHAINASPDTIRKLCTKPGEDISLRSPPGGKLKMYYVVDGVSK